MRKSRRASSRRRTVGAVSRRVAVSSVAGKNRRYRLMAPLYDCRVVASTEACARTIQPALREGSGSTTDQVVVVCCSRTHSNMKTRSIVVPGFACLLCAAASGQASPAPANLQYSAQGRPARAGVSAQGGTACPLRVGVAVEWTAGPTGRDVVRTTQADLVRLRIEHWKTDNNSEEDGAGQRGFGSEESAGSPA